VDAVVSACLVILAVWGLSGTYPDWQIDELRSPEVGVPESNDVTSAAFSQGVVEG
jgi:hypothetical protein